MKIATLFAAVVTVPLVISAAAQVMPNANQTPMPSANGTMPNANQTLTRDTNLPRADGTIAPMPVAPPRAPYSGALCQPGAMTGRCNPIPNPSCLPGQAVAPNGQRCPTPMTP